ncbi:MAG: pyruvate dehydrogenase complex dihydrolipoamide acetyltransferase [Saprospiraceae bacterium]
MADIIRMPRLSDTMEEGNIVGWLKKVGDKVKPGDVLAEVETDKATMELESFQDGYLLYIGVPSGPVKVNGVLAVIGNQGEEYQGLLDSASDGTAASPAPTAEDTKPAEQAKVEKSATSTAAPKVEPAPASAQDAERLKISPLAKTIADNKGIDVHNIKGSGDQGRIIKRDIETAISQPAAAKSSAQVLGTESFTEVPVSQMRKTIARRLGESLFTAPHFYLTVELNMDQAIEARKNLNAMDGVKISFNDLVIKSVAAALRLNPAVNSSWLGDRIRYNQHIHIGVAVAVEDGLVVPVIRHADQKSLSQLNTEVKELAQKAKDKKLQLAEMEGNTFTISNLGMFDIDEFTAIINPPDACILAIGSIVEKPVVRDGQVVVGNMMKVTLSCDHRVVDGATGARFLQSLRLFLENPIRILA